MNGGEGKNEHMNCPHCGADIEKEIDSFIENTGHCFAFIFVCPKCDKALGVRTDRGGKTEKRRNGETEKLR